MESIKGPMERRLKVLNLGAGYLLAFDLPLLRRFQGLQKRGRTIHGKEFAGHGQITCPLGWISISPFRYASWQCSSSENTNRLIQQIFSKIQKLIDLPQMELGVGDGAHQ